MGIEIAGGVYCPLSPRDPEERLHMLVRETDARVVLVHWLTRFGVFNYIQMLDIDDVLNISRTLKSNNLGSLLKVIVSPEDASYAIFTSGSTGVPKCVSFTI